MKADLHPGYGKRSEELEPGSRRAGVPRKLCVAYMRQL